jgi:DNA-binding transcriptional LysR family regulator
MFDFRQLRYFIMVAEELSFTRAAIRLHISQPPLSQQIQALERDLGVTLLERNKRKVALTEAGKVFLEQARQILAQAELARSRTTAVAAGHSGQLRLAYTLSVSFHPALPGALLRHRQIAPGVDVQLREMNNAPQFAALLANEIDVGFVRTEPRHLQDARKLRLRLLDREPLMLALPASHPLATRNELHMSEMADEAFVTQPRALASTLYDKLSTLASAAGFQPRTVQQAQQISGLLALVAAGLGVALVPSTMRAVHLAGVSYVPLADPTAQMLLAVASRADDSSPVLAQFLSTVDEFAQASGNL